MWAEVSYSNPHLIHKGLLVNSIKWRCFLRVLRVCPVRRPIANLDCVLLQDKSLAFVAGLVPEINSRASLYILLRTRHLAKCWLSFQFFIFLYVVFCLETPRDGSGPTNFWTEPSLTRLSAISFPRTPAYPFTDIIQQLLALSYQRRRCFWRSEELTGPPGCQRTYSHISLGYHLMEFHKHRPR
jgi:hypothetical protein